MNTPNSPKNTNTAVKNISSNSNIPINNVWKTTNNKRTKNQKKLKEDQGKIIKRIILCRL